MLSRIGRLLAAPVFDDEAKSRSARLLNVVLLTFVVATVLLLLLLLIVNGIPSNMAEGFVFAASAMLCVLSAGLGFLMRRGYVAWASAILLAIMWAIMTFWMIRYSGLQGGAGLIVYPLIIVLSGLLFGRGGAVVFTVLSVAALMGAFFVETLQLVHYSGNSEPGAAVLIASTGLISLSLLLRFALRNLNDALTRARRNEHAQIEANRELAVVRASLEERVTERTAALERRARQLEVTVEVGRVAATIRDLEELLSQVAALISKRLDFYHVGIFMMGEEGAPAVDVQGADVQDSPAQSAQRYAVLRAASSEGGKLMLLQGYRLEVGRHGIVGYVADTGKPRIALDIGEDAWHFENPLLPYTRSEMALPLLAGGHILGVLDVQSSKSSAFAQEDVSVLQALADQLAIVIENMNLFVQSQEALEAQRRAYGEISREAWRQAIGARGSIGYVSDVMGSVESDRQWQAEMIDAYQNKQIVRSGDLTLAVPITIRDNVEGVVRLCKEDNAGMWTEDEIELVQSLTTQLSGALDSARLYQETQLRAAQQQALGEVTSRIRQTLDVETVLRTAAEQVRQALGLPEVVVQLKRPSL